MRTHQIFCNGRFIIKTVARTIGEADALKAACGMYDLTLHGEPERRISSG